MQLHFFCISFASPPHFFPFFCLHFVASQSRRSFPCIIFFYICLAFSFLLLCQSMDKCVSHAPF